MMSIRAEKWIELGYKIFAEAGINGLKIEQLANALGISKSSFYHHFAALEVFIEKLLQHHLVKSKEIAEKERQAQSIVPDLIKILIEHKTDLLFNRQLRINANNPDFRKTLVQSNQIIGKDFIYLWLRDTKSNLSFKQAEGVLELALENFFLQINTDNINATWLHSYFDNLKRITQSFSTPLYGSD